ncbi:MAG: thiolase domain-containing protein [Candidatus Hydrogenedentota bacterium]|nr:MAG: thiolase domain-containing protein [Candidatus Hydrogenedentota bacterium]
MSKRVYILGGYQTDFARNWAKEGKSIMAMLNEVFDGAFAETKLDPKEVDSIHVGNFAGGLYNMQGHLGGMAANYSKDFRGKPTSRHEAACASGSIAALMARAEIEAGLYDLQAVVGVELMKSVDSKTGGDFLGTAAWYEKEAKGISFPFPKLFGRLGDVYVERYNMKDDVFAKYLAHISAVNYDNAKRNPKAQTRDWYMSEEHACSTGDYNFTVGGRIKLTDCSQVTDGAAVIFLASEKFASEYAKKHGLKLEDIPYIKGWGHRTAPILFDDKVEESKNGDWVLPHTKAAIEDAYRRAGIKGIEDIDAVETHDCFTTSEYAAIEHFGLTGPGEAYKAIEEGVIDFGGKCPFNPSGGLIGAGHPVGATGVRQILDAYKQVTGTAGDYQVEGAKNVATLNIGGSATTNVVHIIGRD